MVKINWVNVGDKFDETVCNRIIALLQQGKVVDIDSDLSNSILQKEIKETYLDVLCQKLNIQKLTKGGFVSIEHFEEVMKSNIMNFRNNSLITAHEELEKLQKIIADDYNNGHRLNIKLENLSFDICFWSHCLDFLELDYEDIKAWLVANDCFSVYADEWEILGENGNNAIKKINDYVLWYSETPFVHDTYMIAEFIKEYIENEMQQHIDKW